MEIAALIILCVLTLTGFILLFFINSGTILILAGAFLFGLMTEFHLITGKLLLFLLGLYVLGEVLEYVFIVMVGKKMGASPAAIAGMIAGGIAGAVLGAVYAGVGAVTGTFLGIFIGAFIIELIIHGDIIRSLKSSLGGVIGRVASMAAKVFIAMLMIGIIFARIF